MGEEAVGEVSVRRARRSNSLSISVLNSPRTYGGFGAGTTGFPIDSARELTLTFLSTGLMEDSYHFERMGVLATMELSALTA